MVAKTRRISKKDLETVAEFIKEEKKRRNKNSFRTRHEAIWKEVDRQIAMTPEGHGQNAPREQWEPNIELGSLADASEIITDDVMRITFPSDRDWYQPHVNITEELEMDPETGLKVIDSDQQKLRDNVYKSLLTQQHGDFGLRHRVKLSIKEALHHGSFVAVCRWQKQKKFFGKGQLQEIGAPVWVPYSMWQAWPDDSPSIIGTNMTYEGGMIVEDKMPASVVLQQPWMNLDKIRDRKNQKDPDITLTTWYGDVFIKRASDDGIFIPNQKVIIYEDWVLLAEENETSAPPVIYTGYERDDVRDPYYSSPLIKRSPTHKLATHCANKYVEAVDLRTKPPIGYDANEAAFRESGGPVLAPGEMFPLRSGGQMVPIEVADPSWALQGLQLFKGEVEEGVGVDAVRKGATAAVEQTAFEISKLDQRSEIRTIDFVATLEAQGLKRFLYMQHELNRKNLGVYGFYNTQLDTPDFVTASKTDINKWAKEVHFEIVGSKGVLGEERRRQGALEVTGFFGSSELFANHLNVKEIMQDAYRDVGIKDPERYLSFDDDDNPEADLIEAQAQQAVEMLEQQLSEAQEKLGEFVLLKEQHNAEKAKLVAEKATLGSENKLLEEQLQLVIKKGQAENQLLSIRERMLSEFKSIQDEIEASATKMLKTANETNTSTVINIDEQVGKLSDILDAERQHIADLLQGLEVDKREREERAIKIKDFLKVNGTPEAQSFVDGL